MNIDKINYEVIDLTDEFSLNEAACYWVDIPAYPSFAKIPDSKKTEVRIIANLLIKAGKDGRLKYAKPPSTIKRRLVRSAFVTNGMLDLHHEYCGGPEYTIHTTDVPPTFFRKDLMVFAEIIGQKPPFLFHEQRNGHKKPELIEATIENNAKIQKNFSHSPDFRSVSWRNSKFTFTSRQAQIIEMLYKAYQNKTPDVGKDYILTELGSETSRLRDSFKNHPAWNTLIVQGVKMGTYRLALD